MIIFHVHDGRTTTSKKGKKKRKVETKLEELSI